MLTLYVHYPNLDWSISIYICIYIYVYAVYLKKYCLFEKNKNVSLKTEMVVPTIAKEWHSG